MSHDILKLKEYAIRRVTTMEESIKISYLMIDIWEMSELEAVPTFEMRAVADIGTVLMAYQYDEPDEPIGYIYAYPNFDKEHYKHYSHMMGIRKDWQSKGVGYNLKLAHRKLALESDPKIYAIEWTVDPLLPNNAALNFGKLGCVCSTYKVNYYGLPRDIGIYMGVPTDRFLAKWILESDDVIAKLDGVKKPDLEDLLSRLPVLNSIEDDEFTPLDVSEDEVQRTGAFLVEVPSDFQRIREKSVETAVDWRLRFRDICLSYFGSGWEVCDYFSFKSTSGRRNFYKFRKRN